MIKGTLVLKDGTFIVKPEVWSGATMRGAPTELPLLPDCLDRFNPALTNTDYWGGKEIKFELAKKFLYNKTVYYANVVPSNIISDWDILFNQSTSYEGLKTFLKENCNPPTLKKFMHFNK